MGLDLKNCLEVFFQKIETNYHSSLSCVAPLFLMLKEYL
jgi:hypothetical protein